MVKFVSAKEIASGAEKGAAVLKLSPESSAEREAGTRRIKYVYSNATKDRYGDVVDVPGWRTSNYMAAGGPVLWAHKSRELPIGKTVKIWKSSDALMGIVEFVSKDVMHEADVIFNLVVGGFMKGCSVGFMPLKYDLMYENDRFSGIHFKEQELLENSITPVPANPDALAQAKDAGIDIGCLKDIYASCLDEGDWAKTPMGILMPRDEAETVWRKSFAPSALIGVNVDLSAPAEEPKTIVADPKDLVIGKGTRKKTERGVEVFDKDGVFMGLEIDGALKMDVDYQDAMQKRLIASLTTDGKSVTDRDVQSDTVPASKKDGGPALRRRQRALRFMQLQR